MIDDLQVEHQSTSVLPVVYMIQEQTTNEGAGDQSKKEADPSSYVKTDEEPCPEDNRMGEETDFCTYRHESGELYAKDVDQHMTVFSDIVMPTSKVTIEDIQVGDPDVPLTYDHEQLRQLIWQNKQLPIGKGTHSLQLHRGRYAILTWEKRVRSRREYGQSRPSFVKFSGFGQTTTIGQDYPTFYITMGFADRCDCQEERRRRSIVYRLSMGMSANMDDGIFIAVHQ